MPDVATRPITQSRAGIAQLLAAAFQNDPVMAFILPDPDVRRRSLPAFFTLLYVSDVPYGACLTSPGGEAATLWRAPGSPHEPWSHTLFYAGLWLAALGPAVSRALAFSVASNANHPPEPHWYLHAAGCDPAHRGHGHGRVAIQAGLRLAEQDGVPAYLETATPHNIGLYQTLGFQVTHSWRARGGPQTWSMIKNPQEFPTPGQ